MNIQNSYKPLTAFLSLLFLLMFFTPNKVSATHEMGGLITWDCLGNGDYVFRFQYYRDCDGIGFPSTLNLSVYNHPTLSSIPVSLVQTIDRSTPCDTCNGTLPGRVEEFIYESSPITLSGIPGPQGWTFTYDICCRNPVVGNLNNPATQGYSFRANMYSYNGQAADPCYDSSPRFAESPDFALCTSFPVGLNNLSVDPELDSLVYEWASAFDQFNTSVNYGAGYAFNSPFPGPTIDTNNVTATLNSQTGEVTFSSHTAGRFVSVVCVRAYKCNQLVAEVFREINTDLIHGCVLQGSGIQNLPPVVTAPFPDSLGWFTKYDKIYAAGDTVRFFISGTDPDWDPNVGGLQTVTMDAESNQLIDSTLYPLTGCAIPPCATTDTVLPLSYPFGVGQNFEWITTCDHFIDNICQDTINYPFAINVYDNYCPLPATNNDLITIKLINPDDIIVNPPTITGAQILLNLDVQIDWTIPSDPFHVFEQYLIYYANNLAGPWIILDSIKDFNQNNYIHAGPVNLGLNHYYYLVTQTRACSTPFIFSASSNKITAIFPGIDENKNRPFLIHPNPATNSITVNFAQTQNNDVTIQIMDALGRIANVYTVEGGTKSLTINIEELVQGIYFVNAINERQKSVSKFLKLR